MNWLKSDNPLLFVPNVICYIRLAFLSAAICFKDSCWVFASCYVTSMSLDLVDGMSARALNQSSRLGAFLDMVTDRMTVMTIYFVLSGILPEYSKIIIFFAILDILPNWMCTQYHSIVSGQKQGSNHKNIESDYFLLNIYYKYPALIVSLVVFHECFLVWTYISQHIPEISQYTYFYFFLNYLCFPLFLLKNYITLLQFFYCLKCYKELDSPKLK